MMAAKQNTNENTLIRVEIRRNFFRLISVALAYLFVEIFMVKSVSNFKHLKTSQQQTANNAGATPAMK